MRVSECCYCLREDRCSRLRGGVNAGTPLPDRRQGSFWSVRGKIDFTSNISLQPPFSPFDTSLYIPSKVVKMVRIAAMKYSH